MSRHLKPHDKGVYDADLAHAGARDNARRQRAGALVVDPELRELVLRQFLPKGKDLSVYTAQDLARAEKLLNSHPRKILNWRTPDLVFKHGCDCVRVLRRPDEFTLELIRRKGLNFRPPLTHAPRPGSIQTPQSRRLLCLTTKKSRRSCIRRISTAARLNENI
ncbi:MAG TPA: hypothetical protein VME67_00115 [Mycobacterium sp.]|nr:hypothetical protein [Mycobacterium sp.]HTX93356.1 hypothetical protein [Mycobacterium sp.]